MQLVKEPGNLKTGIRIEWVAAEQPLEPTVAVANGPVVVALVRRLLSLEEAQLQNYSGVSSDGIMLISGEHLPWVEGIRYLGRSAMAPNLLLPTSLQCSVPLELLDKSLCNLKVAPPIAVLPEIDAVVSFSAALPISRDLLEIYSGSV
ncbi:MAG: hypothetical protein OEZ68_07460 [Gammaproteobacteria bacterium]|nr:hypothetical protein [Gammaproteobacteria bacterium]MDH5800621.1 hypothetical protein [Gammaproteobacteria bacterium]